MDVRLPAGMDPSFWDGLHLADKCAAKHQSHRNRAAASVPSKAPFIVVVYGATLPMHVMERQFGLVVAQLQSLKLSGLINSPQVASVHAVLSQGTPADADESCTFESCTNALPAGGLAEDIAFVRHAANAGAALQHLEKAVRSNVSDAITIHMLPRNLHEYPALHLLWSLACKQPDHLYLYFHAKGMTHDEEVGLSGFRRSAIEMALFREVVTPWRSVRSIFGHLGDRVQHAGIAPAALGWQWFNYFWVRGQYLRRLVEPIATSRRHYFEDWLGRLSSAAPHAECPVARSPGPHGRTGSSLLASQHRRTDEAAGVRAGGWRPVAPSRGVLDLYSCRFGGVPLDVAQVRQAQLIQTLTTAVDAATVGSVPERAMLFFDVGNGLSNQLEGLMSGVHLAYAAGFGVLLPSLHSRFTFECTPNDLSERCFFRLPFGAFFNESSFVTALGAHFPPGTVLGQHDSQRLLNTLGCGDTGHGIAENAQHCISVPASHVLSGRGARSDLEASKANLLQLLRERFPEATAISKRGIVIRLTGPMLGATQLNVEPRQLPERHAPLVASIYKGLQLNATLGAIVAELVRALRRHDPSGFLAVQLRTERDWWTAHCTKPEFEACCQPPTKVAAIVHGAAFRQRVVYGISGLLNGYARMPFIRRGMLMATKDSLRISHAARMALRALSIEQVALVDLSVGLYASTFLCNECSSLCKQASWGRWQRSRQREAIVFGLLTRVEVVGQQSLAQRVCDVPDAGAGCDVTVNRTYFQPEREDPLDRVGTSIVSAYRIGMEPTRFGHRALNLRAKAHRLHERSQEGSAPRLAMAPALDPAR